MAAPGFAAAVEAARRLPKGISDGDRLRLYALFKQATVGEAPLANPASRLDVLSSMKWEAWDAVRGLSAAQAEIRYMELVRILTPTTAATPFHRKDTGNAAATQRTQPRLGPRVHARPHRILHGGVLGEQREPSRLVLFEHPLGGAQRHLER